MPVTQNKQAYELQAEARFCSGTLFDAWRVLGCHRQPDGTCRFAVWAPQAQAVSVVGDFNGWDATAVPMQRDAYGVFHAVVSGAADGSIYKYAVTGRDGRTVWRADPFAFHAETGPKTGSKIWPLDGYAWGDTAFLRARAQRDRTREPMSVYELHLGSWRIPEGAQFPWYRQIADELADYCVEMGYTHVELLPVTEYPFEGSWGYQVTGYFAPTSRYGTPQDFMYFVDRLHRAGIFVLIDWVPAHFPKDEHGLARFDGGPCFELADPRMAEHPDWGTLIFDYAKGPVRSFLISSALFFCEVYHIDGIRVDAVSSMLYLDYGRRPGQWTPNRDGGNINLDAVAFLQALNTALLSAYPGCITVAEESTAFPGVTAPPWDGGLGFCYKWDMGFMHDTLDYLSVDPLFRSGCHEKLTFSMMYAFSEHYILAFSHDEVVHGKRSLLGRMFGDYDQKFATLRTMWGYQFAHPGKKLMFMGAEFGQFIEWDYHKQLDWLLLDYPKHAQLKDYVRALNQVYRSCRALYEQDDSWDGFRWLNVDDRQRSAVAFLRIGRAGRRAGRYLVCACNFTPVPTELTAALPCYGVLRPLLSSDELRFGGTGMQTPAVIRGRKRPFLDMPYSAQLTLPPMSAVYYRFTAR